LSDGSNLTLPAAAFAAIAQSPDDPLCVVLTRLVMRDLFDASTHMMEDVGWTPITTQYARRLRELHQEHHLWDEEPQSIRQVLDGPSS
jgi:hypothetical protein